MMLLRDRTVLVTGGASGITDTDLDRNYASLCDPRLNYRQALEMGFRIAKRLERSKKMTPAKIAPMAVFLLSDAAEGVSSQIFGVRMNEIMLFSANRPVRSVHMSEGWTPQSIAETAIPAMKPHFISLDRSLHAQPAL